ncbi:MAG: hypothetical protein ACI8RZ_004452, partial [Myxococcota bacterium]
MDFRRIEVVELVDLRGTGPARSVSENMAVA